MKLILILLLVLLPGCSTIRTNPEFPKQSELLLKECPPLDLIPQDTTKLSDAERVIAANYMKYHQCSNVTKGWIDWYNKQRENK